MGIYKANSVCECSKVMAKFMLETQKAVSNEQFMNILTACKHIWIAFLIEVEGDVYKCQDCPYKTFQDAILVQKAQKSDADVLDEFIKHLATPVFKQEKKPNQTPWDPSNTRSLN